MFFSVSELVMDVVVWRRIMPGLSPGRSWGSIKWLVVLAELLVRGLGM